MKESAEVLLRHVLDSEYLACGNCGHASFGQLKAAHRSRVEGWGSASSASLPLSTRRVRIVRAWMFRPGRTDFVEVDATAEFIGIEIDEGATNGAYSIRSGPAYRLRQASRRSSDPCGCGFWGNIGC